jgi:hypothetical protein
MATILRKEIAMLSSQQVQTLNSLFFAGMLLWCLGQMGPNSLVLAVQSTPDVTKALHYQPRTPPPVFDPEYIDVSEDSQEFF